ncbi:glycosyltransferase family 2 protein [Plebeiibacterium sediminum]|uniref:Glycosyltransferase family 2 protein n=1 Tax=Plebeiibacterium sediminum TaxID=2992112 RepID=A0AAE3SFQ1_9BACT|nr:glycosyltransferase family 2 protein [Plebeiobacterium sediminum]MCW3787501.1 glycosyltransferase family 2 protein [Plebeiobacterium sediminum]
MSKTAIVILNWNGEKLLQKFLPQVVENSAYPGVEVIVADNASSDQSLQLIKRDFPTVKTIVLDKNYGFTGGYNRALKQVDADYLVLLNSDVAPAKNWIEPLIKEMDENPQTAVCVPKIKSYRKPELFEYAGAAGGYIDRYGYPFCKGRIFNEVEEDNGQYNQSADIFWASGAAMMIRKELYFNLGGLDEDFFAHMEEIDLCWRLKNRGWNIRYVANSEVFHLGGATLDYNNPRKVYLNFRNNLYLLTKNLSPNQLFIKLLQRLLLDGIAAAKFLISGEFRNFYSVLMAHFVFYSNFRIMYHKRKENQKLATIYNHKEIYPHSIVAQFFMHKKHQFSDLAELNKLD